MKITIDRHSCNVFSSDANCADAAPAPSAAFPASRSDLSSRSAFGSRSSVGLSQPLLPPSSLATMPLTRLERLCR